MNDILKQQLDFVPEVQGEKVSAASLVCGGMGGSGLPALALRFLNIRPYVVVHRDYWMPTHIPPDPHFIAISYSGDTEETLSFFQRALEWGQSVSVITTGGELLRLAKDGRLPYVQVPTGPEPRDAIVATTKALLALIGADDLVREFSTLSFDVDAAEREATSLTNALAGAVPVFYASTRNEVLSYIAKIEYNETAKVPAFSNIFPELNHNEMQGWGTGESAHVLTEKFVAVFFRDATDEPRVQRRMELMQDLLKEKGVRTVSITLPSDSRVQTFMYAWWMMRVTARALAEHYGVDPDETPLIKEFKSNL